ncbi:MAG: hypothetical protein IJ725_00235 [Ruminococcus sp.]|nr:hypothetical protein [Ruminococcus sp.]
MIKNQAYINEVDIATYGATLIRGWREALLTPAPAKAPITSTSRLEHGVRVVSNKDNMKLDKRDVQLQVFIEGSSVNEYLGNYEAFLAAITQGEFELRVPELKNRTYKLVYSNCSKYGDYGLIRGIFTLKFTEYKPKEDE